MDMIYIVIVFIFGLIFGSFFNVVGLRIPKGESIVAPPSHCTSCGHQLKAFELIPVFSYLFLRGRCRKCKTSVSLIYPAIELATASLFTISFLAVGWSKELPLLLLFCSLLMIILVSDLAYMIISDKVLLFFGGCFLIYRLVFPAVPWWESYVGALVGFGVLFLIAVVSKGGMGGGDIKLFAVLGFVLGWQLTLLTLFFASFVGAVFGIIAIALKKAKRGQPIPFGPFIVVGALVSLFVGEDLITWYWHQL
ncbi:prepilin peptidase [Bacillus suaedae]|uniref:Prepilin leader peptidase/N-methyltransferase n=1 Tax=Halalkalibacter suaedae TaxID=2822140 RepID=A0A940WS29_9BACI|nr:A24 family peptidase [Bacillus suaedae]MBP3949652.1 prepilin peptidase [Bacillus suaedae]